jgi:hypothetical protein
MRTNEEIHKRIADLNAKYPTSCHKDKGRINIELHALNWVLNQPKKKTASKIVKNNLCATAQ